MPGPQSITGRLRVLAADEDEAALRRTRSLLEQLGHEVVDCCESVARACRLIEEEDPDVALVVVHDDAEHALRLIDEISDVASGPVIALLPGADAEFAEAAAQRGLWALAAEPTAESLQAAIEIAVRRRAETSQLEQQVGQLEHALERRAVIERAKGILMERHDLDERAAFELLRAQARSRSVAVVRLAMDVVDGVDLPPREAALPD